MEYGLNIGTILLLKQIDLSNQNNKNKKVINEMYQDIYFECQEYYQKMIKLSL